MAELPKNFNATTTEHASTHLNVDGNLVTTFTQGVDVGLERVDSIGIANLCDVASHTINHILGSTSHVVLFHDGGCLQFSYSHSGQLLELSGQNIAMQFVESTRIMVVRKSAAI